MAQHDWTEIDWGREFEFLPNSVEVEACGDLVAGDEVLIRLRVAKLDRYSDSDYFRAKLEPAEAKPIKSAWQMLADCLRGIS